MTNMDTAKVEAEVGKLLAETAKFQRERYWYPAMVMATVIGATLAITKLIS